jgi:hypothetical protein
VQTGGPDAGPMTSLARERLLEHFREQFGFAEADLIFHAPATPGHERLKAVT